MKGILVSLAIIFPLVIARANAEELRPGYHKEVFVSAETRIDAIYPLGNQSPAEAPAGWLEGYESTRQRYELYLPEKYDAKQAWPVLMFIPPGDQPAGYLSLGKACQSQGFIFAVPYEAGNNCPGPRRVRIVLDVLDDLRRRFNTDVDRTYIGGFSGGGRIACYIGFALPEYFGGVMPVCAGGELREESWLRRRCLDRLSVAFVTGENDFNRGEIERFRGPIMQEVGVRTRIWVVPGLGHSVPDQAVAVEALHWLDETAAERRKLAKDSPSTRAPADRGLDRAEQAKQLLAEARKLIRDKTKTYEALMLMKGVMMRWPDLPEAELAQETLLEYDAQAEGQWREEDVAEQRLFLVTHARGLDRYASGELPRQYEAQRAEMARVAIQLWEQVLADGQNRAAVAQAQERLPKLRQILGDME